MPSSGGGARAYGVAVVSVVELSVVFVCVCGVASVWVVEPVVVDEVGTNTHSLDPA